MDSETKVVYHGATVVDASTTNPPPYAGYPPPGPAGYPPPGPAGYPPPGPAGYGPPSAVIHTSTPATVIVAQQVGPQPMPTVCRSCNAEIVSRVEKQSSTKTHLFALGLCLLGCWCCVCIPYCTDTCKNTNHYCPNCNAYIGAYKD